MDDIVHAGAFEHVAKMCRISQPEKPNNLPKMPPVRLRHVNTTQRRFILDPNKNADDDQPSSDLNIPSVYPNRIFHGEDSECNDLTHEERILLQHLQNKERLRYVRSEGIESDEGMLSQRNLKTRRERDRQRKIWGMSQPSRLHGYDQVLLDEMKLGRNMRAVARMDSDADSMYSEPTGRRDLLERLNIQQNLLHRQKEQRLHLRQEQFVQQGLANESNASLDTQTQSPSTKQVAERAYPFSYQDVSSQMRTVDELFENGRISSVSDPVCSTQRSFEKSDFVSERGSQQDNGVNG